MQAFDLGSRQAVGALARVNARGMQDFTGIQVADARDQGLIQQGDFDFPFCDGEPLVPLAEPDLKGIGAEPTTRLPIRQLFLG